MRMTEFTSSTRKSSMAREFSTICEANEGSNFTPSLENIPEALNDEEAIAIAEAVVTLSL